MADASTTTVSTADSGLLDTDLIEIVNEVWDAYLQQPATSPAGEQAQWDKRDYTAAVSITGAWEGHVRVLVPPGPARDITAIMLAMEPEEATGHDITDAMGELINVVGGNIKNRGIQPAKLGLPLVATGKMLFPATREAHRLSVRWHDEDLLTFSVLQANPDRAGFTFIGKPR